MELGSFTRIFKVPNTLSNDTSSLLSEHIFDSTLTNKVESKICSDSFHTRMINNHRKFDLALFLMTKSQSGPLLFPLPSSSYVKRVEFDDFLPQRQIPDKSSITIG